MPRRGRVRRDIGLKYYGITNAALKNAPLVRLTTQESRNI